MAIESRRIALVEKIIRDVFETISKFGMVGSGDSILISVSGGPDSIFLTLILLFLKDKYGLKLSCFHLDHMTRDGASRKDAEYVEDFCRGKNLKLFRKEIDCEKWCKEKDLTFQEGARLLRINLLRQITSEQGIDKIAIGHTADDSLETFFLNLFRGSGLSGLGGIAPVDNEVIRPLTQTRRKDILEYLEKNNIRFCIDRTNLENRYERNKVRNLLVPFIKDNFSESFDRRLLKTIEIIRNEDAFLSGYAADRLKEIAQFNMDRSGEVLRSIEIPVERLDHYSDSLKKRIFIEAIKELKGSTEDIKSLNLEDLVERSRRGGGKKEIDLAGGLLFLKEADTLRFSTGDSGFSGDAGQWQYEIDIGKKQAFKQHGIRVFSRLIKGSLDKIRKKVVADSEAYLDFDKVVPPVYIRNWYKDTGERFYPLGSEGSKKLHDFFIDNKIPYSKRSSLPVFADREKIIWVGNLRIDERVKLDKNTKKILYIKIFDI
jgi:tRNA(Ile)-lysidine synthase